MKFHFLTDVRTLDIKAPVWPCILPPLLASLIQHWETRARLCDSFCIVVGIWQKDKNKNYSLRKQDTEQSIHWKSKGAIRLSLSLILVYFRYSIYGTYKLEKCPGLSPTYSVLRCILRFRSHLRGRFKALFDISFSFLQKNTDRRWKLLFA